MKPARLSVLITAATILLFSCKQQVNTLFTSVPASSSNIQFENNLEKKERFGILYYLYYYNGGGVATGDVNNDGLADIYFTANSKGHNKLYLNKGNFKFEDITAKARVAGTADWSSGVTMADVNGDGLLDIYTSAVSGHHGLQGHNELFINNGRRGGSSTIPPGEEGQAEISFTESSAKYGLDFAGFTGQVAFFDYDHDGDLDCYMLNQSHKPNENIVDTSHRRKPDALAGDRLYRNDMNGAQQKFTDVSAEAGIYQGDLGYGLGISIADINNDGWEDIYVGNDFHENDYYYVNRQNGKFQEEGALHFDHYSRFSMGNDIADYNNDGQLDIVTTDMLPPGEKTVKTYGSDENADIYKFKIIKNGFQYQFSKNCLQRNNGNGVSFSETGLQAGISASDWSWCPLLADFDNDGNKDLFISSGIVKRPVDLDYIKFVSNLYVHKKLNTSDKYDDMALDKMPDGASHPFLYKGDGKINFADVSNDWGTGQMNGYYNGAAYADFDNDGNLDLAINCINAPAVLLKNNSPKKNYLSVAFKGDGLNTNGIGAKAYVFAAGKMQYQQLMLTRGFQSSSEPRLHFGLDSIKTIDSLLIVWPNQQYQLIKNTAANKELVVMQKEAVTTFEYNVFFPPVKPAFEDISAQINTGWKHAENDFTDFNIQYLLPHMESTRGPKLAVADVNKDGLDDFFTCGAKGKPGSMMLQTKQGTFMRADTAVFNTSAASEQTDAVFFDANNDGYPDLYVVSGGNEYEDGNPALADKLYINDKRGHFTPSPLPAILTNKNSVAIADIDKDGDNDIFIGGFAAAKSYGYPQPSYLLVNDGKANFTMAAPAVANLSSAGMITSAAFADTNKDGWPDLIVAGEWMPVKIFINNKGIFQETILPQSTGLWQTLYTTDINEDGYPDILAGNWGHNSKLYAGKDGPLKLYVKDFDKNGSVEQVLAYSIAGKEYTFLAKDELEREMPVLKKAYLSYNEVAGQTIQYMFFDLFKDYKELKAEVLGSSVFMNDGRGNFTRSDLPEEIQFAPVFSFSQAGKANTFLAAGNFYGVIPYEGRYDALRPTLFAYNNTTKQFSTNAVLPAIDGEVRDAKWINYIDGQKLLLLARNNNAIVFCKPTNE
ncbi:MAG: VCBS repeat-containing protein [Chitinophagaceae bacterium]